MQTYVLSDLHLGDGGPYEIFAGGDALSSLVESAPTATRIFLNGDAMDFLTNDDPLELLPARAEEHARRIVAATVTSKVLEAFRTLLVRSGELIFRLGNHDVELGLPGVQDIVRRAIGKGDAAVENRVRFVNGVPPTVLDIAGVPVLLTHGEHADVMNRVPYTTTVDGPAIVPTGFRYPPGSRLVKALLNPLKKRYGMRYMDMLKPDFGGAVLTALATNPIAARVVLKAASLSIMWGALRNVTGGAAFDEEETDDLGLTAKLHGAGLEESELDALEALLGDETEVAFDDDDGAWTRARLKLARTGFELYGRFHRAAAKDGAAFFDLGPETEELKEARRLATKFKARVVIEGHTHAARWYRDDSLVYANTGTWIPLMRLPASDANDFEWGAFLSELRDNPGLAPDKQLCAKTETHFHFVRLDPDARTMTLEEQTTAGPRVVGSATLAP